MPYRPRFHLTPPTGRLNDPNGLTLVDGSLHVFYQHDPAFGIGPKRTGWGHAILKDHLLRHYPDALYPDAPYDKNGVYSGGAVVTETGDVQLFYTGNVKEDGVRHATQNRVFVEDIDGPAGGYYRRDPANPLIDGPAPGYTNDYRDPQIVRLADGTYRMALGARTEDNKGAIVIYTSPDLENWTFQGHVDFVDVEDDAYMYECPNLIRLRDAADNQWYDLIVWCPQYEDRDECVWAVGKLDGLTFTTDKIQLVDHGSDFYAPQLIERDGEALMLGWMGLPGKDPDTTLKAEGWLHCLTLPRRVYLSGGELYQEFISPVEPQHEHPLVRWDAQTRTLSVGPQKAQLPEGVDPDPQILHDGCALEVIAGGGRLAFANVVF